MATIRVSHGIGDLSADLARIGSKAKPKLEKIVSRNVSQGHKLAQAFARGSAGPHGTLYYKRITAESSGLEGEYGPHGDVAGNAVGAGWRNGPPNTDLPRSADIQGPKFANDVQDEVGSWFW